MKFYILAIILSLFSIMSHAASPKESAYSDSVDCKAVKTAYEMVKQYFPDKRICVSDSVYIKGYCFHYQYVAAKYQKDIQNYDQRDLKTLGEHDYYSENLHTLFHDDLSLNNKGDYIATFSVPYRRMIICDVYKYGEFYRGYSNREIHEFFFLYDDDGEIIKLSAAILWE